MFRADRLLQIPPYRGRSRNPNEDFRLSLLVLHRRDRIGGRYPHYRLHLVSGTFRTDPSASPKGSWRSQLHADILVTFSFVAPLPKH